MLSKIVCAFLLMGSFGYATEGGDSHSGASDRQETVASDPDRTWSDGSPMSDHDYDHIRDVYLGGD